MAMISSGMRLTPARLNRLVVVKSADETVNNLGTVQDDNELSVAVEANRSYLIQLVLFQQSGATPNFRMQMAATVPATFGLLTFTAGPTGSAQSGALPGGSTVTTGGITGTGSNSPFMARGTVVIGAAPGIVKVQWSQSTANASNTIVRAGSYLELAPYA